MSIAEDLVAWSKPWTTPDFTDLLEVLGGMFTPFEAVAEDLPDGTLGWSAVWDVDLAPTIGLPWLAQFVGERLPLGISDSAARQWIRDAPNQIRGTPTGIARSGQRHLTATKTVMLHPRMKLDGTVDPDWLAALTLTGETPDATVTKNDLLANMPADIKLDYATTAAVSWATIAADYATWADVLAAEPTWFDVAQTTASSVGGWLVWTA